MKLIHTTFFLSVIFLSACGGSSGDKNTPSETPIVSSKSSSSISSVISSSSSSIAASSSSVALSSSLASSSASGQSFKLSTQSFTAEATIPNAFSCDGADINPQLGWEGAPAGTKSFAIIVDDPDAFDLFGLVWVHWNIYNIPATATQIAEGASTHTDKLPAGSVETNSDFGSAKYRGPCPPSGRHHYQFQIFALNKESISFTGPLTRDEFATAYADSIIGKASVAGYFR